jgi:hypothetical protein
MDESSPFVPAALESFVAAEKRRLGGRKLFDRRRVENEKARHGDALKRRERKIGILSFILVVALYDLELGAHQSLLKNKQIVGKADDRKTK